MTSFFPVSCLKSSWEDKSDLPNDKMKRNPYKLYKSVPGALKGE